MSHDHKEPAPIKLVAKIILGIFIGLAMILLLGFAFFSEYVRELLVGLVIESLGTVIAVVLTGLVLPWLGLHLLPLFDRSDPVKTAIKTRFPEYSSYSKKRKKRKKRNKPIREAIIAGKKRRKMEHSK